MLFADVVHSMDIATTVGTERLREIMAELVTRATAVVKRFGGTVDRFTGDGIMALFGAPTALEDHALRACLAALGIQDEAKRLSVEIERRDGITLQLRIGLNSGEVIAGEIGEGPGGYTAVGEQVGMAQRMESVAPPDGVMLSEATAWLVDQTAVLGERELVHIKGRDAPVPARRLLAVVPHRRRDRTEPTFVGRDWEMSALAGLVNQATKGKGAVVGVVGPPGIGKSRVVREAARLAGHRRMSVFTTYCESHTNDVPFHAASALLRSAMGVNDLDAAAARSTLRVQFSDADSEDLVLLYDHLGIGDPDVALPQIDPDARRRRLTALLNAALVASTAPAVYVIEDAHWIDPVSESMLAEFLMVVPRSCSVVLITYRPEYDGALAHAPRSQTIALEPLDDAEVSALSAEMLGSHPSVAGLAAVTAKRAAGNPFFVEEIVRDLSERGVLTGHRGAYVCKDEVPEVSVPATLRAAIAARIDRLNPSAKRTLNAAAVIGTRFSSNMLENLKIEPSLDELVRGELVDQVEFTPRAGFAFRHPLIRAVAYESQLRSDRAQLHRRVAATIVQHDQNAALIAEHLEAAGDLRDAYEWHMRAAAWSINRDTAAAQLSWERASQVADVLPADTPDRLAMRIAPRTLLCGSAWRRFHEDVSTRFEELRDLCTEAGDKTSLAIGMAGLVLEHVLRARIREASRLASEYMALVESIADPTLSVGLSFAACVAKLQAAEWADVLRWTQTVIDLADGDPERAGFIIGSPLATALVFRGYARWCVGRRGWREDLDRAVAMARTTDPVSHATVVAYKYVAIAGGVMLADDAALTDIDEAMQVAERSSDDIALVLVRLAQGIALVNRDSADRQRGLEVLAQLRATCVEEWFALNVVPAFDLYAAQEKAAQGDLDGGIRQLRTVADDTVNTGNEANAGAVTVGLVEMLLVRGGDADMAEAEAAIETLANARPGSAWAARDITVLRLRAMLAKACGDENAYRELKERYRAMVTSLGFEGHMAWAEAMP